MLLSGKKIVLGVTGGIAAYKACYVVSGLKKLGADVHVAMTAAAAEFVRPITFETLSNNRVTVDTFDRDFTWEVEHISLARDSALFVVAPCTADFAGKMACGIADDFLSTTAMAMKCPVLLAPAMNTNMLSSAAYRENEQKLAARGVHFVYGKEGRLACGDSGKGRMAEPDEIVDCAVKLLFPVRDYEGKRVLVTAGGTAEPIDPVRFIGNRSSGKMGVAIAEEALSRGAEVTLVAGNITVPVPAGIRRIDVATTAQMYEAVMREYEDADVIIKAAAPADYAAANFSERKIKGESVTLELKKNPDIAAAVGKAKGSRTLVVFSAETNDGEENARKKLISKNADLAVLNDVTEAGAGFGVDTNIATLVTADNAERLPLMSKRALAGIILDRILAL